MCPNCGRSAPLRFDAGGSRCSACGAPRLLSGGASLSLAGEPQRIGGLLASGVGWFTLLGGLATAGFLGWIGYFLFSTVKIALYVSLPLALLTTLMGGGVLAAGRKMKKQAARSRREAQVAALRAAAQLQGGSLTVPQAALALRVSESEADSLLTELAIAGQVHQEITDQGMLLYSFFRPGPVASPGHLRAPRCPLRVDAVTDEAIAEELEAVVEPPRSRGKAAG
ncbi:MAG: hypothetical protein RMJ98_06945 [Myxococcales bacterium]|nr:hypothetical protein [Polyangiaceae bacterium]MDW8249023.1 hypothetical protein [Myxococcales bacterium]